MNTSHERKKYPRDIFTTLNRAQLRMMYPFYASCLLVCVCFVFLTYLLVQHPIFLDGEQYLSGIERQKFQQVKLSILWVTTLVAVCLGFIIYWAYYVSNRMLGPYERILKDLDSVLATRRRRRITVRDSDEVFVELTKRINELIGKSQR